MDNRGPDREKSEKRDLFEPTGELKGGYDMGMARAYALDHAKKTVGEFVGKGKERRPLLWEIEQSRFDEDAECFEIVLTAHPEEVKVQQKGIWVYHVRAMGGLMPGTPLLRQSLKYAAPRARRRGSRVLLLLLAAVVLVGGGIAAATGVLPGFGKPGPFIPVVATPTPTATAGPTSTPVATPTPVPLPKPTAATVTAIPPSPRPTFTPTPVSPTRTPLPAPTTAVPTFTPRPTPTPSPTPSPTPKPVPTRTPTPAPTRTPTSAPTRTPTPTPIPGPDIIPSLNARVVALRFFESGFDLPPMEQRVYLRRFAKVSSRYINYQLDFTHPAPGRRIDYTILAFYYRPDGTVMGQFTHDAYIESGWTSSWQSKGWGWPTPGNWPTGTYSVELWIASQKVASGSFEIY